MAKVSDILRRDREGGKGGWIVEVLFIDDDEVELEKNDIVFDLNEFEVGIVVGEEGNGVSLVGRNWIDLDEVEEVIIGEDNFVFIEFDEVLILLLLLVVA